MKYGICVLIGAWLTIELMLIFDKSDGGAMPMAQMLAGVGAIGGVLVFPLLWILAGKFSK